MTTPNRIVFEATGKPAQVGDYVLGSADDFIKVFSLGFMDDPPATAYRRIDAPVDSWTSPAPERESVEECPYKVDQQVDCYCVIGPTLHTYGPWPHDALGAAQAVGFADTLNAAYQAGRRAIGGGE